jgi:Mrp family chromosome partitioning ATPase
VLDGPSVPACAESELFCGAIDGVIMMVRWGRTTKGDVFSALRILRVYGIRTIGAVLNNVDIKQLTRSSGRNGGLYRYYADY